MQGTFEGYDSPVMRVYYGVVVFVRTPRVFASERSAGGFHDSVIKFQLPKSNAAGVPLLLRVSCAELEVVKVFVEAIAGTLAISPVDLE